MGSGRGPRLGGLVLAVSGAAIVLAGCVERLLEVRSDPPGATVLVNGEEAGTTPLDFAFSFYGTFAVVVRRSGYESARVLHPATPPWYELFPLDAVAEALPINVKDRHRVELTLKPLPEKVDPALGAEIEQRAEDARRDAHPATSEGETRQPEAR